MRHRCHKLSNGGRSNSAQLRRQTRGDHAHTRGLLTGIGDPSQNDFQRLPRRGLTVGTPRLGSQPFLEHQLQRGRRLTALRRGHRDLDTARQPKRSHRYPHGKHAARPPIDRRREKPLHKPGMGHPRIDKPQQDTVGPRSQFLKVSGDATSPRHDRPGGPGRFARSGVKRPTESLRERRRHCHTLQRGIPAPRHEHAATTSQPLRSQSQRSLEADSLTIHHGRNRSIVGTRL